MIRIIKLSGNDQTELDKIKMRAGIDIAEVREKVVEIISSVRTRGDQALVEYTRALDDAEFKISKLRVAEIEIEEAYRNTPKRSIDEIRNQIRLSTKFHTLQRAQIKGWEEILENGITVGEKWTPIDEVGLYVPGGKNPFPTVQQILAIPAKLAGCKRVVSCISPRGKNYEVLIAAHECGVSEIYRVSGAQAVAAMAYGTESIRPVSLITGPGSPYVTCAKILVQERVAIDMPAGPSEAIILADGSIPQGLTLQDKARFCAADILARAEHGPDSAGVMVTESRELAELTAAEIERQAPTLSRIKYIKEALSRYSAIILTDSIQEALAFTNEYAPEHLEVLTSDPRATLTEITHAGSVFLGYYNPVATGDYASGVNHILPTGGWAGRSSAVGVWTFMKRVQYSELTKDGLKSLLPIVQTIADIEGLDAHKRSVEQRFEDSK